MSKGNGKQADIIAINQIVPTETQDAMPEPAVLEQPKIRKPQPPAIQIYRVARGGTFSMNGQICRVNEGHIAKLSAYGAEGIARMKDSGILLEPIED